MEELDSISAVAAWVVRMTARYGPKVWDQEQRKWLSWEQALTKHVRGQNATWMFDIPVWNDQAASKALGWEFGPWWPVWAVKAHLVDVMPCELEDHRWKLYVNYDGTDLICLDPCDDPRVYIDTDGRYKYPVCQSAPDMKQVVFEIEVKPEWVVYSKDDWYLELKVTD